MAKVRSKLASDNIDLEATLDELAVLLERCKVLYEQHFMGIQKIPPTTVRKDVNRRIQELARLNIRNTAHRYRFNMLRQKYQTYGGYWDRTLRAIENGTYFRSIARASREAIRKGQELPDELLGALPKKVRERMLKTRDEVWARRGLVADETGKPVPLASEPSSATPAPAASPPPGQQRPGVFAIDDGELDGDVDSLFDSITAGMDEAPRPAPPPPAPPRAAARPRPVRKPAAELPAGMTEDRARKLFDHYVKAKKLLGQDTSKVRYEQIVNTIRKQTPRLLAQNRQARRVDYDVVIKDDKVILKAKPKG